jgi:hypothetical protein
MSRLRPQPDKSRRAATDAHATQSVQPARAAQLPRAEHTGPGLHGRAVAASEAMRPRSHAAQSVSVSHAAGWHWRGPQRTYAQLAELAAAYAAQRKPPQPEAPER